MYTYLSIYACYVMMCFGASAQKVCATFSTDMTRCDIRVVRVCATLRADVKRCGIRAVGVRTSWYQTKAEAGNELRRASSNIGLRDTRSFAAECT